MLPILLVASLLIAPVKAVEFHDSHFHLTNYIQEGTDIKKFLTIMGDKVGRSTLFGIPLQQQWSERISGQNAPKYYLDTDAKLYYYSFTDAQIALSYNSLTEEEKKRFDPMITGFNPTDMYAVDHIKRVLKLFPGVFSGIGEFTIHKEFVSSKIAGDVASLRDKALDRVLDFAGEAGLVVILHNDVNTPFPKDPKEEPHFLKQLKELFLRHQKTTIIWAHVGVGRIIQPIEQHGKAIEKILKDPRMDHVYFDISWSEVAKYVVASDESIESVRKMIEKYPDRFLFGTDEVAPKDQESYLKGYYQYDPFWKKLDPKVAEKVKIKNYERIFDRARAKVRAWEKKHL